MTRTLYVSEGDKPVWNRAKRFCEEHKISLSQFVADALRYFLDRMESH